MRWLAAAVPLVTLAIVTVFASLPWGLGAGAGSTRAFLPAMVIHVFTLRRPDRLPAWAAFVAGLTIDAMTLGPLGVWALVYLAVHATTLTWHNWAGDGTWVRGALAAVCALAVACSVAAGLAGLITWSAPDVMGVAAAAVWALVAYPALAMLACAGSVFEMRAASWSAPRLEACLRRPGEAGP